MAIPSDPNYLDVIASALKEAGGGQISQALASTSAVVTRFANEQFQIIKTDFWRACVNDPLLESVTAVLVRVGTRQVTLPQDFDHELSLRVFDGSGVNRGTAQVGYPQAIKFATDFHGDDTGLVGSAVFTLSGPGAGQRGDITEYSNTTKIATVSSAWGTAPTVATTYLVAEFFQDLPQRDSPYGYQRSGRPVRYRFVNRQLEVDPPGDRIYPIELRYGVNLTRTDETGTVFVRHLRERRVYWHQGMKAYAMAFFDDDRYPLEMQKWEGVLGSYAAKNAVSDRMQPSR